MKISAWAIRKPLAPILLFAILMGVGLWGFQRLPVTTYPRMDVPKVSVTLTLDDAAPDQIETEIAMPIEDGLSSLAGLDGMETAIEEGRAVIEVEFATSVPVDRAVAEVRDAVSAVDLPPEAETPVIQRVEQEDAPILTYAVEVPGMSTVELTWHVDDTVIRRPQELPQVRRVDRMGGAEREIEILLDPARLESFGLTAAGVAAALASQHIDSAVGTSQAGGRDSALRIDTAASFADLGDIAVTPHIRLRDVARIEDGTGDRRSSALLDGREAVGIAVYPARTASDLEAGRAVERVLAGLDGDFTLVAETVALTTGNCTAAMYTLAEGAALAIIVVCLFLRDWRATLIVALALPLSVIPTFFVIQQLGFSLNIVSTLAITLVTGILVDDAIVEIENIARHRHMGKSAWRAAIDASDEIGLAVVAISATIIAVFLPVGLMEGTIGQYFRQFGLTVAIAVFFSLLVARLFTPILAARFLKDSPAEEHDLPAFRRIVALGRPLAVDNDGAGSGKFCGGARVARLCPGDLPAGDGRR
ncbi:hypothetical protein GVY41_09140 [Frigidibacter albus]|uniref:MMPL family transporter n=1 Tax=Frigidibacter albus TaxID=1465486 RepID=A0A6L8VHT1_9RHOB|nr:efflux RND transporter permease subunit [Frigidibacter albus]MZQ89256.1 hypothetical protein [Frigidibacter albus]NBE31162.1 hypothetical protein [Frigidibacter albus]GGH53212.1 hypothetical protein GCM10011341_18470 [Frigidibacter albus]